MALVKVTKSDDNTPSTTRKVLMPGPYMDDYGMVLNEDKESVKRLSKYVKSLKTYIRKSDEYTRLMKFLKREGGLDRCGYHPNITAEEFSLNIHHHPFVTEDIIYTILRKRTQLNQSIRFAHVAEEFMRIHYLGIIGLYPLCETCHEYKHSEKGKPFIPLDNLYGEPEVFFDLYKQYMTDKLVAKMTNWFELNKGYDIMYNYIPEELMKHYLYITNEVGMVFISEHKLKIQLEKLLK